MRILQICHSYYPPFLDCARQYAVLAKNTPYQVTTVFLTGAKDDVIAREIESHKVIFLEYKSSEVRGLKLGAIAKIRKIVKKDDFLFCIAHRVKPTYVALLATSLPVISIHHNYNDYSRFSRRLFINWFKSRILMLGVSDSVRDDLRRDLKGWSQSAIQTLYNHIDVEAVQTNQMSKQEARAKLGLKEHCWIIGNVGRLHHDKDQKTLIQAFYLARPSLPANSRLIIIGKGPLEQALKQQVKDLDIEDAVIFTGNVPDAKSLFKAFDVFILSSDHEPFGMVLLEAMAANLHIICSDCGGGAEVVRDIGRLFPFGDAQTLNNCIIEASQLKMHDTVKQLHKLQARFSDQATREKFWSLSFVRESVKAH